jgi:hypothetical protein
MSPDTWGAAAVATAMWVIASVSLMGPDTKASSNGVLWALGSSEKVASHQRWSDAHSPLLRLPSARHRRNNFQTKVASRASQSLARLITRGASPAECRGPTEARLRVPKGRCSPDYSPSVLTSGRVSFPRSIAAGKPRAIRLPPGRRSVCRERHSALGSEPSTGKPP